MKFGDVVTVNKCLKRKRIGSRKQWEEITMQATHGLLIGYRTLSNGHRECDSEYGWYYTPKEYFRAALVVFSDRENPVYVPLSALHSHRASS